MSKNAQVGFQSWNEVANSTSKNNAVDSPGNGVARVATEKRDDLPPATISQSRSIGEGLTMTDLSLYSAGTADSQSESTLKVIHSSEVLGKTFQIYGSAENPLFLAKDVAEWIEHSDVSTMLRSVDEDEKATNIVCTPGGKQNAWFLTENGLYEVLMLSRKPIAKQFKKQIKQILHEVRTKGGYIHARPEETLEELCLRTNNALMAAIERQKAQIAAQSEQLKLQAPAVEYCNTVLASTSLVTVNTIATHLGISAKRLNAFLNGEGWIYRQGRNWCPSAKIRDKDYCDYQTVPYVNQDGEDCTAYHLKWTEPGRRAVIELWNKRHNTNISGEVR